MHIVYSTKNRDPFPRGKELKSELYAYNTVLRDKADSPAILINGLPARLLGSPLRGFGFL